MSIHSLSAFTDYFRDFNLAVFPYLLSNSRVNPKFDFFLSIVSTIYMKQCAPILTNVFICVTTNHKGKFPCVSFAVGPQICFR